MVAKATASPAAVLIKTTNITVSHSILSFSLTTPCDDGKDCKEVILIRKVIRMIIIIERTRRIVVFLM